MGKRSKESRSGRAQVVAPPSPPPLPPEPETPEPETPEPQSDPIPEPVTLPVPEIPPLPVEAMVAEKYRNRIIGLERVPAASIRVHPKNWRTHPEGQANAMQSVLERIGFAAALIVFKQADGSYMLIDGHLRQDLADDSLVPVLVTDLTEREAEEMLATFDHLSSLAVADTGKLKELLSGLNAVDTPLTDMGWEESSLNRLIDPNWTPPGQGGEIKEQYQVLVECSTEAEQGALLEELNKRGLKVRSLMS